MFPAPVTRNSRTAYSGAVCSLWQVFFAEMVVKITLNLQLFMPAQKKIKKNRFSL